MFCRYCGKQIPDGTTCTCQEAVQNKKIQQAQQTPPTQRQRVVQPPPPQRKTAQTPPPQRQQAPRPSRPQKKQQETAGGVGLPLAVVAVVFSILIFVIFRFVLLGMVKGTNVETAFLYISYILPVILAALACVSALLAIRTAKRKVNPILMLVISFLVLIGILACALALPFEGSTSTAKRPQEDTKQETQHKDDPSVKDDVDEVADQKDDQKQTEAVPQTAGAFAEMMDAYRAGREDYTSVRRFLNGYSTASLSTAEADAYDDLEDLIQDDLEEQIDKACGSNQYFDAFETMTGIVRALNADAFTEKLMRTYEAGLILYMDSEAQKLAKEDGKDAAMDFVNKGKDYISDQTMLNSIITHVNEAASDTSSSSGGLFGQEYMIPGSDSRYLTSSDISGMTIKELNYARNEIFARHNYIFKSHELQKHFESKRWYVGKYTIDYFDYAVFNDCELKNIELLKNREYALDSKGYVLDQ